MTPGDDSSLGLEPADLDGHSIEELSGYLDADRKPADPSIDDSPGCQLALQAMERLRTLSATLAQADAEAESGAVRDGGWVARVLAAIAWDARSGRRIPIGHTAPGADLGITEGAVRGIVRAAEDDVEGVIVGRSRFDGDVTVAGEPITVGIEASVMWGSNLPEAAERLRAAVRRRLEAHTDLNVAAVDVTVHDVYRLAEPEEKP